MWNKIIDVLIQWLKDRPRNDLLDRMLELLDSMAECHRTWLRWEEVGRSGAEEERERYFREWRGAFGRLDEAVRVLDEVLRIYDPEAHEVVMAYHASESVPNPEDGENVIAAAVAMTGSEPQNTQSVIEGVDFVRARKRLDVFIGTTFRPEEIAAARSSLLRQSGFI